MKSSTFALVASFATIIVASPLHMAQHAERQETDVKYVTDTAVVVETARVTRYVTAGAEQADVVTVTASSDAASSPSSPTSSDAAQHENHRNGGNQKHHWSWSQGSQPASSSPAAPPVVVSSPPPVVISSPPPVVVSSPPPVVVSTPPPSMPSPSPSPMPTPTTSTHVAPPPPPPPPATTQAAPSEAAPVANNPGTATSGMTYKSAASPYPQPATWTNQAPESYNAFDGTLQQASLNATNKWRSMFNAKPVVWNYTLEQQIVDVNNNKTHHECSFMHTGVDCGQNIAAGSGSPMESIDSWGSEYTSMNWNDVDWSDGTGHFTQLVWQETTAIGCAAINCDGIASPPADNSQANGWFYVCNYWPTGNMLGDFPANVKPKLPS